MDIKNIDLSVRDNEYIAVIENRAFKINSKLYSIISEMQKGHSLLNAMDTLSIKREEQTNIYTSFKSFEQSINKTLSSSPISYISCKLILFRKEIVTNISSLLGFLFYKSIFIVLFIISLITNIYFFVYLQYNQKNPHLSIFDLWILFCLSCVFILLHEFGHATASYHFKMPAKDIGFGFYLIFPVFYTDVTRIWLLPKTKRITVNLGGIYFQLLSNVVLIIAYCFTFDHNVRDILVYFILSNLMVTVYSSIPFFRNDGYWIYSDLFDIKNLLEKADNLSFNVLFDWDYLKGNISLVLFTIGNWIFRVYVVVKLGKTFLYHLRICIHTGLNIGILSDLSFMVLTLLGICLMIRSIIKRIKK